jgi:glycosyltransferase involved in cell wall biosynthesis
MKVVALTNHLSSHGGGVPAAMLRLYELLACKGIEVTLVASDPPEDAAWAKVVIYKVRGPRSFAFSPNLLDILRQERPDLLHLHGLWSYGSIATQFWRRQTGKPVVISAHGMLDPWALQQHALKKWIGGAAYEWSNLRHASCIHALTEGEAKAISMLGFRGRVEVIPNGVDLMAAADAPYSGTRKLLYIGRLHPKKGLAETLMAWTLFQRQLSIAPSRWQLIIAGWDDGGHLNSLRQLAEGYGLSEHVQFAGPVFGRAKEELYASADAVILASHSEGLPMTVLEAWTFGRPVFITEQCNLPEGFKAGAAFRITTDPRNIAETLANVLPNQGLLANAGQAGRELVQRIFDWKKISERWFSVYESLIFKEENAPERRA